MKKSQFGNLQIGIESVGGKKGLFLYLSTPETEQKINISAVWDFCKQAIEEKEKQEYTLVSDNDGHEYVIPAEKEDEFYKGLMAEYEEFGSVPEWAEEKEVTFYFKSYRLE